MSHVGLPLIDRDTSKSRYGAPVIDDWRVAIDAYQTMVDFLKLTPQGMTFNEHDRQALKESVERLGLCVGQMDSGKRGKGISFDEVPHIMSRISAIATLMVLSGSLDRMEVDP